MKRQKFTKRAALILGALILLALGFSRVLSFTSSTAFCSSFCHEMAAQAAELRSSPHALDADGREIGCARCHIPQGFGPAYLAVKTYSGVKDVYVHLVETPPASDRTGLQKAARRFIDDDNCLACHTDLYKDAKGEKEISDIGRFSHDAYLGKNGQAKSNCAGCHVNMAHLPEWDRRLEVNRDFAGRLKIAEEARHAN